MTTSGLDRDGPESHSYWPTALRAYAKLALWQSAVVWGSALVVPPLLWILHGLKRQDLNPTLTTVGTGLGIGALFFLAALGIGVGYDVVRNWRATQRVIEWNPLWFWKAFLYFGSLMFLSFVFFAFHQGAWLSVEFGFFSVLCWFGAHVIAPRVKLPERPNGVVKNEQTVVSGEARHKHGPLGFVAMEYYALILNRSFIILIAEDGLYGWKFHGIVSSFDPEFYFEAEALLEDPTLRPGARTFASRRSFFIAYNQIQSVDFIPGPKWGMGWIPHSGRLTVRVNRRQREFIILGAASGSVISGAIRSKLAAHRPNSLA